MLRGIRIAVTRAEAQAEDLAAPLRAAGAEVVLTPLIRIVPTGDGPVVEEAIKRLHEYDWIVFTSVNGVDLFTQAIRRAGRDMEAGHAAAIACVGPATAAQARKYGWDASVIPEEFVGHAIADALAEHADLANRRILLARAGGAREELPARLRKAGAIVTEVELYHAAIDEEGARALRAQINDEGLDLLTFTSASTVRYFKEAVGEPGRSKIAVIGPMTAATARSNGLDVHIEAEPHTTAGLVTTIVRYYRGDV